LILSVENWLAMHSASQTTKKRTTATSADRFQDCFAGGEEVLERGLVFVVGFGVHRGASAQAGALGCGAQLEVVGPHEVGRRGDEGDDLLAVLPEPLSGFDPDAEGVRGIEDGDALDVVRLRFFLQLDQGVEKLDLGGRQSDGFLR
jgi:hypothetical protein